MVKEGYIIAPSKIKVGDPVLSADQTEMKAGNCMKLANIPLEQQFTA
jgi:large subunit ribosomal protein L2